MWRCDLLREDKHDKRICGSIADDLESFRRHVEVKHGITPLNDDAATSFEHLRLGPEAHDRYWCGFCKEIIPQQRQTEMQSAPEARFKHIGDHYDKEDSNIANWICVLANKPKGELSAEDKKRARERERTGCGEDDEGPLPGDGIPGLPPLRIGLTEPASSAMAGYETDMAGPSAYNTSNHKRRRLSQPEEDEDADCVPDDDDMERY